MKLTRDNGAMRSIAAWLPALTLGALWAQSMGGGGSSALVWPAQGEYAGSKRCAVCHQAQARSYGSSSMSRALEPIDRCEILTKNPRLTWSEGKYRYVIEKVGDRYRYAATDGAETAETTLLY